MMNDPKDPFHLTRGKVFAYGSAFTLALVVLIWFYAPGSPKTVAVTAPLQGPGSVSETLTDKSGAFTQRTYKSTGKTAAENYSTFCAQCHGATGDGESQMSRMMSIKVPNLLAGPFQVERTQQAIAKIILEGTPSKAMPGFSKEISPEDSVALADFVLAMPTAGGEPTPNTVNTPNEPNTPNSQNTP
jgi:mono/diheme cytochrome c family protein